MDVGHGERGAHDAGQAGAVGDLFERGVALDGGHEAIVREHEAGHAHAGTGLTGDAPEKRRETLEREQNLRRREVGRSSPQTPMICTSMVRGRGPSSSAKRIDWKRPRASSPPVMPTATLR